MQTQPKRCGMLPHCRAQGLLRWKTFVLSRFIPPSPDELHSTALHVFFCRFVSKFQKGLRILWSRTGASGISERNRKQKTENETVYMSSANTQTSCCSVVLTKQRHTLGGFRVTCQPKSQTHLCFALHSCSSTPKNVHHPDDRKFCESAIQL